MAFFRSKGFFLSVCSGLLLWLSLPGNGQIWPLLFIALVPLFWTISRASAKEAVLAGLCCGLVHFTTLLYWIVIVLGTYGGIGWFISVQALLLMALYMSSYLVFFAVLARYLLLSFPAAISLWLLPALWVGIDWLRGQLFTGFPWMDLGYALYQIPQLLQIAELAGHHGVTFLVVFINSLLLLIFYKKHSVVGYFFFLVPAICLLGGVGIYSQTRFLEVQQSIVAPDTSKVTVGIVQGNIDQSVKWSPSQQQDTVDGYLLQTRSLFTTRHPSLVIWPETALPFYPPSNNNMQPLQELVATYDFALLTGAPWYEIVDRDAKKANFFNSALLLLPDGHFGGKYYKSHLVPFGEYIPLKKFLPFLAPLVEAVGDFSFGSIEQPLSWREARAGVLICFESVFSELSRQWVLAGANILVNLTNDAWYGKSSAPYQSLAMSVLRAVETRRSLVRSANTGISAFVTPVGTITKQSELFVPWAASEEIVLGSQVTFWVRYGYLFAPLCLATALLAGLLTGLRRRWGQTLRSI